MSIENVTIGLAGIYQATELVRQIARQGLVDQRPFEDSVSSILKLNANSIEEIYNGLGGVKLGLQLIVKQYSAGMNNPQDVEIMRYIVGVMVLERKLIKHKAMLQTLQVGINQAAHLADEQGITHNVVLESLAELYSKTLSTFTPRIQVLGEPRFLENPINAHKIRTMLLAGVRSAVLWRQKGGSRFQLLFSRGKIARTAKLLLEQIQVIERVSAPPSIEK